MLHTLRNPEESPEKHSTELQSIRATQQESSSAPSMDKHHNESHPYLVSPCISQRPRRSPAQETSNALSKNQPQPQPSRSVLPRPAHRLPTPPSRPKGQPLHPPYHLTSPNGFSDKRPWMKRQGLDEVSIPELVVGSGR
ncbi:unnamed protein product [Diplocarpon coronariae]